MWTNPSQKSRQGSDPPHSGNACILGVSGPATPPLLNKKYPKSRMCCQKTVVGKKFHFGTAQLMCQNKLLGVVGGALGRLQVILSDSCHSYL